MPIRDNNGSLPVSIFCSNNTLNKKAGRKQPCGKPLRTRPRLPARCSGKGQPGVPGTQRCSSSGAKGLSDDVTQAQQCLESASLSHGPGWADVQLCQPRPGFPSRWTLGIPCQEQPLPREHNLTTPKSAPGESKAGQPVQTSQR